MIVKAAVWFRASRLDVLAEAKQRRAIRTDDFVVVSHIKKDVRVIIRWLGADAFEFACANMDDTDSYVVVKMRGNTLSHT